MLGLNQVFDALLAKQRFLVLLGHVFEKLFLGHDPSRADHIHPHPLLPQFACQGSRETENPALGGVINSNVYGSAAVLSLPARRNRRVGRHLRVWVETWPAWER